MTKEQQERVINNEGLVHACYSKYIHHGWMTYFWREDLLQEGRFGLCKAAVTFDEKCGMTFATYATICIRNEMLQALRSLRGDFDKCYLDDIVGNADSRTPLKLSDTLNGQEMTNEDDEEKIFVDTMRSVCSEEEKRVVDAILDGYRGKALREKLGTLNTKQAVNRWYQKFIRTCKKMWQLSKSSPEFPKKKDYVADAFYFNDLKRLWDMPHKEKFKRSINLLKNSIEVINDG